MQRSVGLQGSDANLSTWASSLMTNFMPNATTAPMGMIGGRGDSRDVSTDNSPLITPTHSHYRNPQSPQKAVNLLPEVVSRPLPPIG